MLYLGIDQHARQITISLRDENWGCRTSLASVHPVGQGQLVGPTNYPGEVEHSRRVRGRPGSLWIQR